MISLERLFVYNHRANEETLRSVERASSPPEKALERLGHLVGAEEIWLQRLCDEPPSTEVWPRLSLSECRQRMEALHSAWMAYLESLPDDPSDHVVRYTNSKGEAYTSRVDEVLMHVLLHAAYHRGQIANDLRAAGETPAVTDFIFFAREGRI